MRLFSYDKCNLCSNPNLSQASEYGCYIWLDEKSALMKWAAKVNARPSDFFEHLLLHYPFSLHCTNR